MKVIHSSLFRALCAIIVGCLLIEYREQTVTWITIAIGVLFFLSGIVSLATYYSAKRSANKAATTDTVLHDAEGRQLTGISPNFPIVGLGSVILGAILALMPDTFISWLMFILAMLLIMGAVSQFVNLASARRMGRVGLIYWLLPCVILLVGLIALLRPSAIASSPLLIIGWAMMVYGVVECVNALKVSNNKRKWAKAEEISSVQHTAEESTSTESDVKVESLEEKDF